MSKTEIAYYNYNEDTANRVVSESGRIYLLKQNMLSLYDHITNGIRKRINKSGNRRFTNKLLDKRIPNAYREAAQEPIDENKIVFVEVRHEYVTNSFQIMFDELANHYDYNIHVHFLLNSKTTRTDYANRVINAARDIATAKYVFLNEGSNAISAIPLREGTKVIQLWHGCGAFKRFGFSTADLIFGASRKEQLRHPFNKNYSLVTVSSPEVIWAYKEAMNLPEDSDIVQPVGSSRTDIFFDKAFIDNAFKEVYRTVPQARDKKIILYAPTFRGRVAKASTPDMLNVKMFYEAFCGEYVLLFNHHPLVKIRPEIPQEYADFAFDVTGVLSIEDLICVSDICISDYSSLVFEYSLFERPLIFFAYDLEDYFDWRGFYYDYNELAPGLIARTNREMIDYIQHIDTRFDKQAIIDFKDKFMSSCDGHATQRILEYAFDNLEAHRKPCEQFEVFHTVPKVENSYFPYYKKLRIIREQKEYATPIYRQACQQPIVHNSRIAFDITSPELLYLLKQYAGEKLAVVSGGDYLSEVITKIAQANYIFIDQPNSLLDSLPLRAETKVILIPEYSLQTEAFGVQSKEYRSGLKREQYQLAPLFCNLTAAATLTPETAERYMPAYGKEVEALVTGDVRTDVLFDKRFQKKALKKLYAAFPQFEGKKLIAFVAEDIDSVNKTVAYEYLSDQYAVLMYTEKVLELLEEQPEEEQDYYTDAIADVSEVLTLYELLSVADILIGEIRSEVLTFMATGKPLFIYAPAMRAAKNTDGYFDTESLIPTKIYHDFDDIVQQILDIRSYDYTKYYEIKRRFLPLCNGRCTDRLLNMLQ